MISYNICPSLPDLLHLEWLSQCPSVVLQMALFHSFYGWATFHCDMYHIFFIHSSISGHLGCFHVVAVVENAVMSIMMHVSFWIVVLSRHIPKSGIPGSHSNQRVIIFLVFWGNPILFSIVAAPTYILTNSVQRFLFLPSSPAFATCGLLNGGHS